MKNSGEMRGKQTNYCACSRLQRLDGAITGTTHDSFILTTYTEFLNGTSNLGTFMPSKSATVKLRD